MYSNETDANLLISIRLPTKQNPPCIGPALKLKPSACCGCDRVAAG